MKKLFFALVIGLMFVVALTSTALADNGPHGGTAFTASGSMDACASCHRAHTGQSTAGSGDLLKQSSIYGLCLSCHDGTGAYTNVKYGVYDTSTMSAATKASLTQSFGAAEGLQGDAGASLFGGGFAYTVENHSWLGNRAYTTTGYTVSSAAVTSSHQVDDSVAQTAQSVWGSGDYNTSSQSATGGINPTLSLTCTSCHDPHGNAGTNGTTSISSYRILKYTPDGSNGYEITSTAGKAFFTNTLAKENSTDATSVPT